MSDTQKHTKPNVPNLRFPGFSGEWKQYTMGEITELFSRRNKNKVDYPMFSVTNARGFVNQQEQFEDREMKGEDISAYKIVSPGEFAYNPARINVGSIARYNGDKDCMISSLYVCFKAKKELVDSQLLLHILKSPKMVYNYGVNGEGGVRIYLFYPNFARIRVKLPSLDEQRTIASFLDLIEERIQVQNKVIEKYESLIKALTDKVVDEHLKGRMVPFNQMYIQAGEGGTPSTSVEQYYLKGTIPFIKIDDLSTKYLVGNKVYITELGLGKSSAWLIPSNSVIYSNGATIGAISINTYPVSTKQGILGIVPAAGINTEYLYYLMSSRYFSEQVQRIITEGTMKTAYLKDMNKIPCPLPSSKEQQKIVAGLSALSIRLESEQKALLSYESIKKYLIRNLFIS